MIIFVYGTLKQGDVRGSVLADSRFVGTARTSRNYTLFNCGAFPAMVEATNEDFRTGVVGELYEVDPRLLDTRLDAIEGRPFLYDRGVVEIESVDPVNPEDAGITSATAYIYQRSVSDLVHLGQEWRRRRYA